MSSRLTVKHETRFDASWTSPSTPETLHGCCASGLCNILVGKHGVELTQVCFALRSRPKTQSYRCIDPVATPYLNKAWYDRVIDLVRDGSINTSMAWIGRPDIHFGRAASSSGRKSTWQLTSLGRQVGDTEIETLKHKLLIFKSIASIIRLLSANNTYFRDNIVYIITFYHFILLKFSIYCRK
jgi:hypothetical protein